MAAGALLPIGRTTVGDVQARPKGREGGTSDGIGRRRWRGSAGKKEWDEEDAARRRGGTEGEEDGSTQAIVARAVSKGKASIHGERKGCKHTRWRYQEPTAQPWEGRGVGGEVQGPFR
eukprot:scaffold2636_cov340-Pavlova_lutheri.AAC.63